MKYEPCPQWEFVQWVFDNVPYDESRLESECKELPEGMLIEFGVAGGDSIKRIRKFTGRKVFGFDSWEGLPEDWSKYDKKGKFKCDMPDLGKDITLIKGMFQDTLDTFLAEHPGPVALCHIDCDLYSSTAFVLGRLKDRFIPGSLLIFDEIIWTVAINHEAKAFYEYLCETQQKWVAHARHDEAGCIFRMAQ